MSKSLAQCVDVSMQAVYLCRRGALHRKVRRIGRYFNMSVNWFVFFGLE